MRKLVDRDEVATADQRRNDPGVGKVPRAEHAGGGGTLELRKPRFELIVERMIAGNEARGAGADSELVDGLAGRLGKRRMGGQAQIIVTRERDQLSAAAPYHNTVMTRRGDERAAQMPAFESDQLGLNEIVERGHGTLYSVCSSGSFIAVLCPHLPTYNNSDLILGARFCASRRMAGFARPSPSLSRLPKGAASSG